MKLRQLTLLPLLGMGAALWLTRAWWLPALLAQLPFLEERSDLVQGLDALVSLGIVLFELIVGYLLWIFRWEETTHQTWEIEALRSATPQDICEGLGRGGLVKWIDRGTVHPGYLRQYNRLVITGRMKVGKTREAVELIRRSVAEDLVPKDGIYEPGPALRFSSDEESLRDRLRAVIDFQMPVLLFLDDLPYHFHGASLKALSVVLDVLFKDCTRHYVVATARSDQLTEKHQSWIIEHGFEPVQLNELDAGRTRQLVDHAANVFDLQVEDAARAELVNKGDGTPELTLMGLRRLRVEGVTRVDQVAAKRVALQSVREAWLETRRYIEAQEPPTRPLLNALAEFHTAEVEAYEPMVLDYAAHLWRQDFGWPRPWHFRHVLRRALDYLHPRPALDRALEYLAHFDILVQGSEIVYPDMLAQEINNPQAIRQREAVRERVRAFLERRRWVPPPEYYYDRANKCYDQGEYAKAIADYDRAIKLDPEFAQAYYNQGLAHAQLNEWEHAITDYGQALSLDPDDANTYRNRGIAYVEQGEWEHAITDYSQALSLDPDDANTYRNRGIAHVEQGEWIRAIADYSQALSLDPDHAKTYYERGNAYAELGEWKSAIVDYDRAIKLDPTFTEAYNSRGLANAKQGKWERAIADYDRAIELDSEFAEAYNNRGLAHARLREWEKAIADYSQAIKQANKRDPEFVVAYRNRAEALIRLGRLADTEADCRMVEQLALDEDPYPHSLWARLAYARGDHVEAIRRYRKAADLSSEGTAFNINRALSHLCLGQGDDALNAIRARLKEDSQPDEVGDILPEYEALQLRQPDLSGLSEALAVLRGAVGEDEEGREVSSGDNMKSP